MNINDNLLSQSSEGNLASDDALQTQRSNNSLKNLEETAKQNAPEENFLKNGHREKYYILGLIHTAFILWGPMGYGIELNSVSNARPIQAHFALMHGFTNRTNDPEAFPSELWSLGFLYPFGGLVSALLQAYTAHIVGRKTWTLIACASAIIGGILKIISRYTHVAVLFTGRFIDGIGGAGFSISAVLFLLESVPPKLEKFFKSFIQFFLLFGIFFVSVVALDDVAGDNWHLTHLLPIVVYGLLGIILLFHPESPKYIYNKTRDSNLTRKVLQKLRGKYYQEKEFEHLKKVVREVSDSKVMSFMDVIRVKQYRLPLLTILVLNVTRQFCGANAIVPFGPTLMIESGFYRGDLGGVIINICTFVGSWFAIPFIAKAKRKLLYMSGISFVTIVLALFIICEYAETDPTAKVVLICLFQFSQPFALASIPWIISGEMFPSQGTGVAQSTGLAGTWLINIVVFVSSPIAFDKIGTKYIYVFLVYDLVVTIYSTWLLVETQKKSVKQVLEEYDMIISPNVTIKNTAGYTGTE